MVAERKRLVDPEPVTVFLAILGAAGSVASLLAYVEAKRERRKERERVTEAKAFDALGAAEVALFELTAHIDSLRVFVAEGTRDRPWFSKAFPLRFGGLELYLSTDGMKRWQRLVSRTNATSSRLHSAITKLLGQFASSEYKLKEETANLLHKMQDELNLILERLGGEEGEDELERLAAAVGYGKRALASLRRDLEIMFR